MASTEIKLSATVSTTPGVHQCFKGVSSQLTELAGDWSTHALQASSTSETSLGSDFQGLSYLSPYYFASDWTGLPTSSYNTTHSGPGYVEEQAGVGAGAYARLVFTQGGAGHDGRWAERADVRDSGAYTYYDWYFGPGVPSTNITATPEFYIKWQQVSGPTSGRIVGGGWSTENSYYSLSSSNDQWLVHFSSPTTGYDETMVFDITIATNGSGTRADTRRFALRVLQV